MIAALEVIATIADVRLFGTCANHEGNLVRLSRATDNKGNSHVVSKLLTTKFPLCVVLMQLTADLGERGFELDLRWTPREENVLADALSNGDTTGMDPALRKRFELSDLRTLSKLLVAGEEFYAEAKRGREAAGCGADRRTRERPQKRERLKESSPWE